MEQARLRFLKSQRRLIAKSESGDVISLQHEQKQPLKGVEGECLKNPAMSRGIAKSGIITVIQSIAAVDGL